MIVMTLKMYSCPSHLSKKTDYRSSIPHVYVTSGYSGNPVIHIAGDYGEHDIGLDRVVLEERDHQAGQRRDRQRHAA